MLKGQVTRYSDDVRVLRWTVLLCALASTCLKILIASRTFGTNDVHYWMDFARGARRFGPVGMYGHPFIAPYNHPPLAGWMLVAINWLTDHGADFTLLIKMPASLADVASAVLLFEILRRRRPCLEAALAGILLALSPLMVIVSGFHGNTDPAFVAFSLLALYLVAVKDRPMGGGVALGIAVSIKLVPVILGPMLLVLVIRRGPRSLARFAVGGLGVFALLWLPVLLSRRTEFTEQVLGYSGIGFTQWGLPEFLVWTGVSPHTYALLVHDARPVALGVSALLPALMVWRSQQAWMPAAGLSFSIFLLLSPAFGMQYLVWPLAAAYLIGGLFATYYNVLASVFAWTVYSDWSGGGVWGWFEAKGAPFDRPEMVLMLATWLGLLLVVYEGVQRSLARPAESTRPSEVPAGASRSR